MGITKLTETIKKTGGVPAEGLKEKTAHVDLLSLFYGRIQSKAYDAVEADIRSSSKPTETSVEAAGSEPSAGKRQADEPLNLDSKLHAHLDKQKTVIHVDGLPSIEKSAERRRRQETIDKSLDDLKKDIEVYGKRKQGSSGKLYRRCRNIYRPPRSLVKDIVHRLQDMGWNLCECFCQADTHIGEIFRYATERDSMIVITGDSDLMVMDGIEQIVMPAGQRHVWTSFSKSALLKELKLPTSQHLQLVGVTTKNDYYEGSTKYGLHNNSRVIREMALEPYEATAPDEEVKGIFGKAICQYLDAINNPDNKELHDFDHAISALVLCKEEASPSATPSAESDAIVRECLSALETIRRSRKEASSQDKTSSAHKSIVGSWPTSTTSTGGTKLEKWAKSRSSNFDTNPRYTAKVVKDLTLASPVNEKALGKIIKSKRKGNSRRTITKKETTDFSSEALHNEDVPADEASSCSAEISNEDISMKSFEKKLTTASKSTKEATHQGKPPKQTKRTVNRTEANESKKIFKKVVATRTLKLGCIAGAMRRATNMTPGEVQTVTERINAVTHILSRARIIIFKGLETFVFRNLPATSTQDERDSDRDEDTDTGGIEETSIEDDMSSDDEDEDEVEGEDEDDTGGPSTSSSAIPVTMDPLDILLDKQHGPTLLRNLGALVIHGTIGGRSSKDPNAQKARSLAREIYNDLEPEMTLPLKGMMTAGNVSFSVPIADMAAKIHTNIRVHFKRLPVLISSKMPKVAATQDVQKDLASGDVVLEAEDLEVDDVDLEEDDTEMQEVNADLEEDDTDMQEVNTDLEEDDTDLEEDDEHLEEDTKCTFSPGHVAKCWKDYSKLGKNRPVFVPGTSLKDTFHQLSELFFITLLWGNKQDRKHPTKSIMESHICSRDDAVTLEKHHYGELIHRLFVGDKAAIRKDRRKSQTSYGKTTTTMRRLVEAGKVNISTLDQYRGRLSDYFRRKKDAESRGSVFSQPFPTFPSNNDAETRYALSNQLSTNGLRLHVMAFDTRKGRTSSKLGKSIPRIETMFPDRHSITSALGENIVDTVIIGVDPGERISAALCKLDLRIPRQISNLAIRRKALYAPSLAFRSKVNMMKEKRVTAAPDTILTPSLWCIGTPLDGETIKLPTINELQHMLPPRLFESLEKHTDGFREFAQVFGILHDFYSSKTMKKLDWELEKAMRAEMDLAVSGALRMTQDEDGGHRKALFAYGNGKFDTHTKLKTMHQSFKRCFLAKVPSSVDL
ncbi:hypothetical protein BGX34_003720 [Mortierella sp. NVP85]|nr:hypothetical protein BGX34_003720 [Mortierella sp. NVP85]